MGVKDRDCFGRGEIRDAMIDPRVTFDINPTELTLLEQAEAHLLGCDRTAATALDSPALD